MSFAAQVRVPPGSPAHLKRRDPSDTLGITGGKTLGRARAARAAKKVADLQPALWAEGKQSLLVVLQGIDASGKDGATRGILTGVNPQGTQVTSFKAPTPEELRHDFLWRISAKLPEHGVIGVFNRSHYEDVVTTQSLGLIDSKEARRRVHAINAWERHLVEQGTTIVKAFLHISKEEQRERLQARIDEPAKNWKMELSDLETRKRWDDIHRFYDQVIGETSTDHAPWHIIPSDRKWLRDVVLGEIVGSALDHMAPKTPPPNPELKGVIVE